MTAEIAVWHDSPRWKVAHRLHPRPTEEFLGATYWRTLCGKRVNASRIEPLAHGHEPAFGCETCERSRQALGEEVAT